MNDIPLLASYTQLYLFHTHHIPPKIQVQNVARTIPLGEEFSSEHISGKICVDLEGQQLRPH